MRRTPSEAYRRRVARMLAVARVHAGFTVDDVCGRMADLSLEELMQIEEDFRSPRMIVLHQLALLYQLPERDRNLFFGYSAH